MTVDMDTGIDTEWKGTLARDTGPDMGRDKSACTYDTLTDIADRTHHPW